MTRTIRPFALRSNAVAIRMKRLSTIAEIHSSATFPSNPCLRSKPKPPGNGNLVCYRPNEEVPSTERSSSLCGRAAANQAFPGKMAGACVAASP